MRDADRGRRGMRLARSSFKERRVEMRPFVAKPFGSRSDEVDPARSRHPWREPDAGRERVPGARLAHRMMRAEGTAHAPQASTGRAARRAVHRGLAGCQTCAGRLARSGVVLSCKPGTAARRTVRAPTLLAPTSCTRSRSRPITRTSHRARSAGKPRHVAPVRAAASEATRMEITAPTSICTTTPHVCTRIGCC